VIVQTNPSGRNTPDDIEKIFVRGRGDAMIPLSALVKLREIVVPRELNHFGQRRSRPSPPTCRPTTRWARRWTSWMPPPARCCQPGYSHRPEWHQPRVPQFAGSLTLVFILALFFIFLVLAAQFESFVDPFVIMLSVPLSMAGALLALQMVGRHAQRVQPDRPDHAGGLITKHGILMVEFANQLREQGLDTGGGDQKSASQRLRPIMMTTGPPRSSARRSWPRLANRHRKSLPSVDRRARLQSRQKACVTLLMTPTSPPPSA
jgi:multidrug efflux pump